MSQTPINKSQQVYADRYGNQQPRTEANPRPEADYDTFDVPGIEGFDTLGGMEGMEFDDISRGQVGEGMGDQDLINGMSEEEYVAHYRNNVAPQNQREAEALMAEVGEGEAPFNAKKELAALKTLLNKSENSEILDEDTKEELQDKIRDLEKLIGKPGTNAEELQEKIEGLKEEIDGAIEAGLDTRKEQVSGLKSEIDALEKKIEKSRLSSANKDELRSQLTDLEKDLKKPTTDLEASRKTLEDIEKAFRDTKPEWPGATILGGIPQNQSWADEATIANGIAQSIDEAFANDDWQKVIDGLNQNVSYDAGTAADQGERNRNTMNNVVRKLITGIYKAAGSMDEFMELMKMIPAHVREQMITTVTANTGELAEIDGDQWSSAGTASAIRQSLETPEGIPSET